MMSHDEALSIFREYAKDAAGNQGANNVGPAVIRILSNSNSTMPDDTCEHLGLPQGSTVAQCVQKVQDEREKLTARIMEE